MKKILLPALAILASVILIAAVPTEAEGAIYEDTVRLHILANSDSEEDQALKYAVRDEILSHYGERLSHFESAADAEAEIDALIDEIETFAAAVVAQNGYDYSVRAKISSEYYPTREYEDFTLPRGEYMSLQIVIGDGEGQNWWCVMYPPLCLGASVEDGAVSYTDEEIRLVKSEKLRVKFKILELLRDAFG